MKSLLSAMLVLMVDSVAAQAVPFPPEFEVQIVAEKLFQNGYPMVIQKFQTSLDVASVQAFYHNSWADPILPSAPGYIETRLGDWLVISRLTERENLLVQLREDEQGGGSTGFLATVGREVAAGTEPVAQLMPSTHFGGELLSSTQSKDRYGSAVTSIYRIAGTVEEAFAQLQQHFAKREFEVIQAFTQGSTRVMFLAGANASVEVATHPDAGGHLLLLNVVVY